MKCRSQERCLCCVDNVRISYFCDSVCVSVCVCVYVKSGPWWRCQRHQPCITEHPHPPTDRPARTHTHTPPFPQPPLASDPYDTHKHTHTHTLCVCMFECTKGVEQRKREAKSRSITDLWVQESEDWGMDGYSHTRTHTHIYTHTHTHTHTLTHTHRNIIRKETGVSSNEKSHWKNIQKPHLWACVAEKSRDSLCHLKQKM